MPATPAQVLTATADLLEKGFDQGFLARNAAGQVVAPTDPSAVCFCTAGAISRATHDLDAQTLWRTCREFFMQAAAEVCPSEKFTLTAFNDTHTKAQVVATVRRAAVLAA